MEVENFPFLVGLAVEQVWVWGPVRLIFSSVEPEAYVDVDEPRYVDAEGNLTIVDFVHNPEEAGVILSLLWKETTAARSEDGILRLFFETGAEIQADPDDEFESWSVVGAGHSFQCMARGEVLDLAG